MRPQTNIEDLPRGLIAKWLLMAVIAGSVNAGGFLACARYVSHVTGFATLFAIDLVEGAWQHAIGILTVPFWFLTGVMVAAYLTDGRLIQGRRPRYSAAMALVAGALALAALGGMLDVFGLFNARFNLASDYGLLVLLCFATGVLNAVITSATNAVIRCTHLTGVTTDLGIGLMRLLFGRMKASLFEREKRRLVLRVAIIASFCVGSALGAALFTLLHYPGFFLPSALALYVGALGDRLQAPIGAAKSLVSAAGSPEDEKNAI